LSDTAKRILSGAVAKGRVPNAYLFIGTDALSLLNEAVTFARSLGSRSADLLIVSTSSSSTGAQNKSIKIDEIRQITDFVKYGPAVSSWKVIIMDGAEKMTDEAFNSFLKTLEEPHKNILFILTTVRESFIPRTISSRCQKVLFSNEVETEGNDSYDEIAENILKTAEMSIPQLLQVSEEMSEDKNLAETLNKVLFRLRNKIDHGSRQQFLSMKQIFSTKKAIERNSNKRLALDSMFLSLKEAGSN